jgi:hypothetical protein
VYIQLHVVAIEGQFVSCRFDVQLRSKDKAHALELFWLYILSLDLRFHIAVAANLQHNVSIKSSAAMICPANLQHNVSIKSSAAMTYPRAPKLRMHDIFSVKDDKFTKALIDFCKTKLDFKSMEN